MAKKGNKWSEVKLRQAIGDAIYSRHLQKKTSQPTRKPSKQGTWEGARGTLILFKALWTGK